MFKKDSSFFLQMSLNYFSNSNKYHSLFYLSDFSNLWLLSLIALYFSVIILVLVLIFIFLIFVTLLVFILFLTF